ncbi:MAG: hypothetical protein R2867_16160 [Caldilineaceae bacterium]
MPLLQPLALVVADLVATVFVPLGLIIELPTVFCPLPGRSPPQTIHKRNPATIAQ